MPSEPSRFLQKVRAQQTEKLWPFGFVGEAPGRLELAPDNYVGVYKSIVATLEAQLYTYYRACSPITSSFFLGAALIGFYAHLVKETDV